MVKLVLVFFVDEHIDVEEVMQVNVCGMVCVDVGTRVCVDVETRVCVGVRTMVSVHPPQIDFGPTPIL